MGFRNRSSTSSSIWLGLWPSVDLNIFSPGPRLPRHCSIGVLCMIGNWIESSKFNRKVVSRVPLCTSACSKGVPKSATGVAKASLS